MAPPPRIISILDEEGWAPIEEEYRKHIFEFHDLTSSLRNVLSKHDPKRITIGGDEIGEVPIRKSYVIENDKFWLQEDKGNPNRFLLIENNPEMRNYPLLIHFASYYPVTENGVTKLQKRYKPKQEFSPILSSPPPSKAKRSTGKSPISISSSPVRGEGSRVSPALPVVRREQPCAVPPRRESSPVSNGGKSSKKFTRAECEEWKKNKTVNPRTKRKISVGKGVYNKLAEECK